MQLNDNVEGKHLKKSKSNLAEFKVLGRKIVNDCIMSEPKRKKKFPNIVESQTRSRQKQDLSSKLGKISQERSLSLHKIYYERLDKSEFSLNLSPERHLSKSRENLKKVGDSVEKFKSPRKDEKKSDHLSLKEKLESIIEFNDKFKENYGKTKKLKKPSGQKSQTKRLFSPRDKKHTKDTSSDPRVKHRPEISKKLPKKIIEEDLAKKPKKIEEKAKTKKSPDRKNSEDQKKRKKKSKKHKQDLLKSPKLDIKQEKSLNFKSKHLKNKKLDFQIFCKRNDLASSAETTRKRVRQKFDKKKDPDGQSSSVKIHKKQENTENFYLSDTVFKIESDSLESFEVNCFESKPNKNNILPGESLLNQSPKNNKSFVDADSGPKTPKKVEKVPIESFQSILKSKHPSLSIEEDSDQLMDSLEADEDMKDSIEGGENFIQSFDDNEEKEVERGLDMNGNTHELFWIDGYNKINHHHHHQSPIIDSSSSLPPTNTHPQNTSNNPNQDNTEDSIKMISNLDIYMDSSRSGDLTEFNADENLICQASDSSSVYSSPEESLKQVYQNQENFVINFIEKNEIFPEAVKSQAITFDEELFNIIENEVENFIHLTKFFDRKVEVDSSSDFLDIYFENLSKLLVQDEYEILSSVNSAFFEDPLVKLTRIQTSQIGTIGKVYYYEVLLPINIESKLQDLFICVNRGRQLAYSRLMFEVVNEAFNYFRPFGFDGLPEPWSSKLNLIYGESKIGNMALKAKKLVKIWQDVKIGIFSGISWEEHAKVEKVREDRMNVALALNIENEERNWINYEFEETQSIIEIAGLVFSELVLETTQFLLFSNLTV